MNENSGELADITRALPYIIAAPIIWGAAMSAWLWVIRLGGEYLPGFLQWAWAIVAAAGMLAIAVMPIFLVPARHDPRGTIGGVLFVACPLLVMPVALSFY